MASLALIRVFYVFIIFHLQSTKGKQILCNSFSCGDIDIEFPFGLKGSNQDRRCSYYPNPSFQLSCDNQSRTILELPNSGNMVVKSIDYETQSIQVNDPEGCLAKRFLHHDWNLSGSPFKLNPEIYNTYYNLTFLRCRFNATTKSSSQLPLKAIPCLSDEANSNSNSNSSSVIVVSWAPPIVSSTLSGSPCEVISTALVPLPWMDMSTWPFWPDLNSDVGLVWTEPRCGDCAFSGQVCGFSKDKVGCFPSPSSKGISRRAKYGIVIGVGIPGLLCLVGFSYFICGKIRFRTINRGQSTNLPTTTIYLQPVRFAMGLDGATIDKYPKTLLGESGRLLKPNDNTCSICLSEYEPKETLRSIPDCNHYFHAVCIDEWLRMNGTCPICRNSPEASSTVTSSFSSLLLSPTPSMSSSR